MGYIISEEAQDILKDVKKFCDKEIRDAEDCRKRDE